MAHTITVTTAGNALGQYCVRYGDRINQTLRQGFEFERDLPKVSCDYAYQGQDVTISDILQPYQVAFTPNNTETFDGPQNILQIGKVDLEFDWAQMNDFYDKWKCNWFEAGKETNLWTYPRYIMDQVVLPKVIDEINEVSWSGVYAAPTPGTPGALATTFDGFGKLIADAITATTITPIVVGALLPATFVAQTRTFCAGVPMRYRYKPGTIYMSKTNAQLYADDFAAKFPGREVVEKDHDRQYLRVDHYNKRIVGLTAMEGSDRFVLQFDNMDGLIIGTKRGMPTLPQFRVQSLPADRAMKVVSEIYRFYGVETWNNTFVSDQA